MIESQSVDELIEGWRLGFANSDPDLLKALWAREHPNLTCMPTELSAPLKTLTEIEAYYDRLFTGMKTQLCATRDIIVDAVSPTIAFGFARAEMQYYYEDRELYWNGRLNFVALYSESWRFIHYEDSTALGFLIPGITAFQKPIISDAAIALRSGDLERASAGLDRLSQGLDLADLPAVMESSALAESEGVGSQVHRSSSNA